MSEFLMDVPETNHVSRECSFAVILYLRSMVQVMLFPVLNVLYFYITTFQNLCAVLNIAVFEVPRSSAVPLCCSYVF